MVVSILHPSHRWPHDTRTTSCLATSISYHRHRLAFSLRSFLRRSWITLPPSRLLSIRLLPSHAKSPRVTLRPAAIRRTSQSTSPTSSVSLTSSRRRTHKRSPGAWSSRLLGLLMLISMVPGPAPWERSCIPVPAPSSPGSEKSTSLGQSECPEQDRDVPICT